MLHRLDNLQYNDSPYQSIIAWHFTRNHHLVYIDRKYISYLSLPIKVLGCNLFSTKFKHLLLIYFQAQDIILFWTENSYHRNFSLFFLVFRNTPIHHTIRMPSNEQKFFLNLCFLGLPFFIAIVPLNKFIIVAQSSSSSHIFACPCVTNQSGTYSKEEGSFLTALSHFLEF